MAIFKNCTFSDSGTAFTVTKGSKVELEVDGATFHNVNTVFEEREAQQLFSNPSPELLEAMRAYAAAAPKTVEETEAVLERTGARFMMSPGINFRDAATWMFHNASGVLELIRQLEALFK